MILERRRIIGVLPILFIIILWNIPLLIGNFYLQKSITLETILLEMASFSFFVILGLISGHLGRIYLFLGYLSLMVSFLFVFSGLLSLSLLYVASSLISLRFFSSWRGKGDITTITIAFTLLMILLLLTTSIRFLSSASVSSLYQGYMFSINDNSQLAGIPFTYYYGVVLSMPRAALTFSPIILFLFPMISYLTADNTVLIAKKFSSEGFTSVSGPVFTVIACQCENTIAVVSGTVSSFTLSVLPFFIFLSAGLLLGTNIYLHKPKRMHIPSFNKTYGLILLLLVMIAEFAIVYRGLINNLSYFGIYSFLSVGSGLLLGLSIPFSRKVSLIWVIFAFGVQIMLFIPFIIEAALTSVLFFELYNIAGFGAGIILSLSIKGRRRISRIGIVEFIFSMETMISALFLYLTLFSISIFSNYQGVAVLEFSVLILLLSIPIMWFSNIHLINVRMFYS